MEQSYLLTIITVTFNAEDQVRKTLESIVSQELNGQTRIEYIVQDGCSKDRTVEIVKSYAASLKDKRIDLKIRCEKDKGIYDAMNKGINICHGKWICLLNAGDTFFDAHSLENLLPQLKINDADVLYADYKRTNQYISKVIVIPDIALLESTMIFCHQAVFIRDYVYNKEKYNLKYRIVADYDLMLRLYLGGYKFDHINNTLIEYDTDGISATNMVETYKEIYEVRVDQKVINNSVINKIFLGIGIIKRIVLSRMPQKIRWKVYKIVKGIGSAELDGD